MAAIGHGQRGVHAPDQPIEETSPGAERWRRDNRAFEGEERMVGWGGVGWGGVGWGGVGWGGVGWVVEQHTLGSQLSEMHEEGRGKGELFLA